MHTTPFPSAHHSSLSLPPTSHTQPQARESQDVFLGQCPGRLHGCLLSEQHLSILGLHSGSPGCLEHPYLSIRDSDHLEGLSIQVPPGSLLGAPLGSARWKCCPLLEPPSTVFHMASHSGPGHPEGENPSTQVFTFLPGSNM